MAGDLIRPADLVTERTSPVASEFMVVDNGVTVAKSKISDVVKAGFPLASQAEAEAGTNPSKAMTPLTTKQAVTARIGVDIASKAQGDKADTAVQPEDLADVATSGDYDDLSGKPTLGTAAAEDVGFFATAAQGALADTAVQPYPTAVGLAALTIPDGITFIRTNGYYAVGDGGGAQYRLKDGGEDALPGDQTSNAGGKVWALAELLPNVRQFGAVGDGVTDDAQALQNALDYAAGGKLFLPEGVYPSSTRPYVWNATKVSGAGRYDFWDTQSGGSVILAIGTGATARWTDIDGTDSANFSPFIICAGSATVFEDLAVICAPDAVWDAGIYLPGVRQTSLNRVITNGPFRKAGVYGDATWSSVNTTLTTLHPEIESSSGLNETTIIDSFLNGGLWGLLYQGTTRNPDSYSTSDFVWATGGTSDLYVTNTRLGCSNEIDLSIRETDGGCFKHDAAVKNTAKAGQGHNFVNCSFRSYALHEIYLDRSNRDTFVNCYGENPGGITGARGLSMTSNTSEVVRINDRVAGDVYLNGTNVGTSSSANWFDTGGRLTSFRTDGRIHSPNIEANGTAGNALELISHETVGGEIDFYKYAGSTKTLIALLSATNFRGVGAGTMSIGSNSHPLSALYTQTIRMLDATGPRILAGAGSPDGVVTGGPSSVWLRSDGGAGTALYVKHSGTGNTGWVSYCGRLTGTSTYDPASLADGAGITTTVTVTGAALGDVALASFSLDTQGVILSASVTAANTVSVRFQNETGGVIDLASGTLKAVVLK